MLPTYKGILFSLPQFYKKESMILLILGSVSGRKSASQSLNFKKRNYTHSAQHNTTQCPHTQTNKLTNARTHACTYKHTHSHVIHTYTHTDIGTNKQTQTNIHRTVYRNKHMFTHAQTHTQHTRRSIHSKLN